MDPMFIAVSGIGARPRPRPKPAATSTVQNATSASPVNKIVQTTQMMRNTVNRLEKRRDFLEKRAMQAKKQALQLGKSGNKTQAITYLRRHKLYEKEGLKMHNVIAQVETQLLALESSGVLGDAVGAMNAGLSQQQKIRGKLNPDKVADTLDEIQDITEEHDEIQDILAGNFADGFDEADLLAELDDDFTIEDEVQSLKTTPVPTLDLPSIPDLPAPIMGGKIRPADSADEDALKQLEAELL